MPRLNPTVRKTLTLLLALVSLASFALAAVSGPPADLPVANVADYLLKTVPTPQVGSTGGEWAVFGLARAGFAPESYTAEYYESVKNTLFQTGGILHELKYTEYSRVVLALAAIGADPRNVGDYDLLLPLGDYDNTVKQGILGPVWALIALDSCGFDMPENPRAKTPATRDLYLSHILSYELPAGGFALSGSTPDPDTTAMVLQTLATYADRPEVRDAVTRALSALSLLQQENGGFISRDGIETAESTAQVIIALSALGIDIRDDRFIKGDGDLAHHLLSFLKEDSGFAHLPAGPADPMATEQAFLALAAWSRASNGLSSLFSISETPDHLRVPAGGGGKTGLAGKHEAVFIPAVSLPGKTFSDITGHAEQAAIARLAERGILSGKSDTAFSPDASMTRAELAAAIVRALGLTPAASGVFSDVTDGAWYAPYVGTAHRYGLITGISSDKFDPSGTVTREAAAVIITRAAALCGLGTEMSPAAVRDTLAPFGDYRAISGWATGSLAFCYQSGILPSADLEIRPSAPVLRSEAAGMLYRMLKKAELL